METLSAACVTLALCVDDAVMTSCDLSLCVLTMQMSGNKGISAFPESDNLFKWIGTIDGAQGTVRTHTHTHTGDWLINMYIINMSCVIGAAPVREMFQFTCLLTCLSGVRGPQVPVVSGVSGWLSISGSSCEVCHSVFSSQCGWTGFHLSRHPEGQMVGALRRPLHPAVHPEPAWR